MCLPFTVSRLDFPQTELVHNLEVPPNLQLLLEEQLWLKRSLHKCTVHQLCPFFDWKAYSWSLTPWSLLVRPLPWTLQGAALEDCLEVTTGPRHGSLHSAGCPLVCPCYIIAVWTTLILSFSQVLVIPFKAIHCMGSGLFEGPPLSDMVFLLHIRWVYTRSHPLTVTI